MKRSDGEEVEALGAEAVGGPAGQRDDAGQGEGVAGHRPGDLGRGGVELALEGLQRDRDDGDVEDRHDGAEDDHAGHHQDALVELVGVVRLGVAGLELGVGHPATVIGCVRQRPNPFRGALRHPSDDVARYAVEVLDPRQARAARRPGGRGRPTSTSRITRRMLRQVSRARSSADQPRSASAASSAGIGGDVLEADGQHLDAVVVAAEPDVVDPGDLAHVLAVRDHVGQRRRGLRVVERSRRPRRPRTVRRRTRGCPPPRPPRPSRGARRRRRRSRTSARRSPCTRRRRAAIALEHVVGGVARAVGDRAGRAVAEDHRRLG